MKKGKVKWVDDLSAMTALHLPTSLVPDTRPDIPRPVPYRGRHGLRLPEELNELQSELQNLNVYAETHLMSVNHLKTKVMLFFCSSFKRTYYKFMWEVIFHSQNVMVDA